MLKDIAVNLSGRVAQDFAADYAISMAAAFGAHVAGVAFLYEPVIHDGLVVLGEGDGNFAARVVARDVASGAERWSVPAPASFESGVTPGAAGADAVVSDEKGLERQ